MTSKIDLRSSCLSFSSFLHRFAFAFLAVLLLTMAQSSQTAAWAQGVSFRSAQIALGSNWQAPIATAIDARGDLFVLDRVKGEIDQVAPVAGLMTAGATPEKVIGFASLGPNSNPVALAADAAGNLYVVDQGASVGQGRILQIAATGVGVFPASPTVTVLVTGLSSPAGVAVDASGDLFFSQAIAGTAAVSEIVASAVGVFPASPTVVAVATGYSWNQPAGLALDGSGNLLVAETGSGSIDSIAKSGGYGTVTQVATGFTAPVGIAADASGNLYVTDSSAGTVVELAAANGIVSPSSTHILLGTGWSAPTGVASDARGNLYVADARAQNPVLQVATSALSLGAVQLGAGSATATLLFAFSGSTTTGAPLVLTAGSSGLDFADHRTGSCTTQAGTTWAAASTCTVDVVLTPRVAGAQLGAVEIPDDGGNLLATAYVSGVGVGSVAGFSPGAVTSVALTGLGSVSLSGAGSPVFDAAGNLYLPDPSNGRLIKLAAPITGSTTASPVASGLATPTAAAMDGAGNMYLATGGNGITKLSPAGVQTVLSNGGLSLTNTGVAVDGAGNVYTADSANNRILWFPKAGTAQVFFTGGALNQPYGIAADAAGNLYVANYGGNNVVKIANGVSTILSATYQRDGSQLSYSNPMAIALDPVGNVYVADTGNDALVMIPQGTSNGFAVNLNGNQASLPAGVAVDRNGNLVAIDAGDSSIWMSAQQSGPSIVFAGTAVGASSNKSTVDLLSMGNAAFAFAVPASGSNPAISGNFTLLGSSSCPSVAAGGTAQSLAAGSMCSLDLTFAPQVVGALTGSLTIAGNASNAAQQTLTLGGTGESPTISITPAAGTLTDGSVGSAFAQPFKASGGTAPYTYALTVTSGALPAGVQFNTTTGLLSGTPTATGTVAFTVVATDSSTSAEGGPFLSAAQAYSLSVSNPTIRITPASLGNGTAGAVYAAAGFAASGGTAPYTYAVTSGALPAGMSLAGGVLSGTPTAAGVFNFTVTATDANKISGNHDYALTINPPALGLSPAAGVLPDATAENAYSQQFAPSGGTAPYTVTVSSGALPAGLTLSTTGLLSGTPAATGTFIFTVQVADSTTGAGAPFVVMRSYTLTVYAPIVSVIPMEGILAPATVGQTNYTQAFTAKGGNGTYTYALTAGALPAGMSLVNGVLSGVPKAVGSSSFTVTATDSNLFTGGKMYSLAVGAPTITVTPTNPVLSEGMAESGYSSVSFGATSANGGTAPYTYALTAGALPTGMSLVNGVLSGTPATSGTFYITVTATDANHQTGSREYALTIAPPVVTLTTTMLLDAAVGLPYRQVLSATGGSGTYIYTASGLPAWLTLEADGTLHGTPATADIGADSFTITATDASGFAASRTYALNVYAQAATSASSQSLGTVSIGGAPATAELTFNFNGNFTLGTTPVAVLTQGATGLDFASTNGGTCATGIVYGENAAHCTVEVAFAPLYPGLRMGQVQLIDSNGNVLATRMVYGTGKGALANFLPGVESQVTSSLALKSPQSLVVDAAGALYVADPGNNQVLRIVQGAATTRLNAASGLGAPASLAVDGAGNVFVADPVNNTIWEVAAGNAAPVAVVSATVNAPATPLKAPQGVAVDGKGNLYIADTGNQRVLISTLTSSGYATPVALSTATALQSPVALTVSSSGSIYIADAAANVILIEPSGGTQTALGNQDAEAKITADVNAPAELAVDANGNVYLANSGAKNVLKAVAAACGGFNAPVVLATTATLASSAGVALAANGNIYLSDSTAGIVYAENYAAPPASVRFATKTGVGSLDAADGAQSFTMLNLGNDTLNFASTTGIVDPSGSFVLDSQSNCDRQNSALAANGSCLFAVDFAPTQVGAPLTALLALAYNNLAAPNATNTIALSGTSLNSFVFNPAAGALTAGAIGAVWTQGITVTGGGVGPYTYAISAGALPTGITLNANSGSLGGTPTASGDYAFVVTATDSKGDTGSAAYTLAIAPDASAPATPISSTSQTVTFTFSNAATVAQVLVLTQGATGLDFTDAGNGSCNPVSNTPKSFNAGSTCTVVVNFTAAYPGTCYGAVELLDASGDILATSYITGVGTAPLALFSPGARSNVSFRSLGTNGLNVPAGMVVDAAGNLYLADVMNNRIVKVTAHGAVSTIATGAIALHYPTGVAMDGAGNLFIADNGDGKVVEVSAGGVASVLDNGGLTITNNFSVTVDGSGNVYTTDLGSQQASIPARILEYPAGGKAQAVPLSGAVLSYPTGLAVDGAGTLWIIDNATLVAVKSGTATALANGALSTGLSGPALLTVDGPGNLYISDTGNGRVLMLPAGSTDLGSALTVDLGSLCAPFGVAIGGAGDLYISDAQSNNVVHGSQQTPSELDFDATVGSASADQAMHLVNAGNSALTLTAAATSANPVFANSPSNFTLDTATTCAEIAAGGANATVNAGKSCAYAIKFSAASFGVASDALTVTDNSNNVSGATQKIVLTGATVTVSPNSGAPATAYALTAGTQYVAYNASLAILFTASGGHGPYCFGLAGGSLPRGLSLTSDGILWGTPYASGTFSFTVQATDANGQTGTQLYTLAIAPAALALLPAAGALPNGTVQLPYSQQFTAAGGTAPYSFALTAGKLPAGLAFSRTGLMTGLPTAAAAATSLTVTATDAYGQTVSAIYSLTVNPPPVTIAPAVSVLPAATSLLVYSQLFTASGGTAPYSFAVASGSLPPGLSLNARTGLLSGVPTLDGAYTFTLTATDSASAGPFSGSQSYTLNVAAPLVKIAPSTLANGAVGEAYSQQLSASGGSGTYLFSIASGTLPTGLTLNAGGLLAGTPTAAGVKSFTLAATDTVTGASAQLAAQPTIFSAPATAPSVAFAAPESVGTWSSTTATVVFTFHGSSIVNSFAVLTNGIANLEFKWAHTGTCTITEYNDGDSCTLDFYFKPTYPGLRVGAVQLLDPSGAILGTALISGTGVAAIASVTPATELPLASAQSNLALAAPQAMAVDASGNVYVADASAQAVFKVTPSGNLTKALDLASAAGKPVAVVLDGAGNLFVADAANNTLWRQAPGAGSVPVALVSSTVNTPAAGLGSLGGLALDAGGNLSFAVPASNLVYTMTLSPVTGYSAPTPLPTATSLNKPSALAVDAGGNLYIADTGNNRIVIEPAGGSTSAGQETSITTGLVAPAGVAVDLNGNVSIANTGANTVLLAVRSGSSYAAPVPVPTTAILRSATGVALDGRGNLYIADATAGTLLEENYSAPRPLNFAKKTILNTADTTDGVLHYTLFNAGNATLQAVAPGLTTATDFPLSAGSGTPPDCTASFALAANGACNLSIGFKPTSVGALNETMQLVDNSLAQSSATQQIALSGTGLPVLQITWATPADISYGTPLSAKQLDASSGVVAGTFTYTPAANTLLNAGTQTLSALFTPADAVDYSPVTTTVPIVVHQVPSTTTLLSSANPSLYGGAVTFTATVLPSAGMATGTVNFLDGATNLGSASLINGQAALSLSNLSAGQHSITAVYAGDTNCITSTSPAVAQQVIDFTLTPSNTGSSTQSVSDAGTASYSLAIVPNAGSALPWTTTLTVSGLPGLATVTLNNAGWTQLSPTSWSLPANTPISAVDLSIQLHTTATAHQAPFERLRRNPSPLLLGILLLPLAARLRRAGRRLHRLLPVLLLAVVTALASVLGGCSAALRVVPGTYNVVVTVQTGTLAHSTTLELKVQ